MLEELGVDLNRPIVAFVGRITRQKGVAHLIAAAHHFAPEIQLVLCAGAPDTPEIAAEVTSAVQELARVRSGVFWVREMLPIGKIREILSAATVFVCPSVYEPLGIVNLEAMACATAVVASDVGGIPEVVADRQTGLLVHYDASDPAFFERRLAEAVNSLVADPEKARQYGQAGGSAASKNSPGRTSPSRPWRSTEKCPRRFRRGNMRRAHVSAPKSLAGDALELVAEGGGFFGGEFDDESPAAFQWYPHHDAAPLLGCFQWTVAGPGLHRRHRVLPPHELARSG